MSYFNLKNSIKVFMLSLILFTVGTSEALAIGNKPPTAYCPATEKPKVKEGTDIVLVPRFVVGSKSGTVKPLPPEKLNKNSPLLKTCGCIVMFKNKEGKVCKICRKDGGKPVFLPSKGGPQKSSCLVPIKKLKVKTVKKKDIKNTCTKGTDSKECKEKEKEALIKKVEKKKVEKKQAPKKGKDTNKKTVKKLPKIAKKLSTSKKRNKEVKKLPKEQRKVLLKHFAKGKGKYIKKHGKYNKKNLDEYTKAIKDPQEKKIVQAYTKRMYEQRQAQNKSRGVSLPARRPVPPTKKVSTVAPRPHNARNKPSGNTGGAPPMVDTGSGSYEGGRQKPQKASSGGSGGFGGIFGAISGMVQQALQKKKQQKPSNPQPPKPTCDVFTASNRSIHPGETTELRWSVRYSDFSSISGLGGVSPNQGSVSISPSNSTDYTMQSQNRYGSSICPTVRITVLADESDSGAVIKENPMMSCSPNTLERGGSSIILWQCPQGTTRSAGSSTEYGEFTTYGKSSGSARVAPAITSTFVVRCRDAQGKEVGRNSCTVRVVESNQSSYTGTGSNTKRRNDTATQPVQNKSTLILKASKYKVPIGKAVTINWDGRGADNCTLTGPDGFKEIGNKGDITGRILQTSTFVLQCSLRGEALPTKEITISAI